MPERTRPTPPCQAWLLPLTVVFLSLGILLGRAAEIWWPALAAACLAMGAAAISSKWRRSIALFLTAAALGALLGWHAYHPVLPAEAEFAVRGTIAQEIHLRKDGQVQTLLTDVTLDGSPAANAYWTYYLGDDEPPPDWLIPGAQVELTATLYHPDGLVNPGGFNFKEYLLQRSVHFGLYGADGLHPTKGGFSLQGWSAGIRHRLTLSLMDIMGPHTGAYAAAMLLGTRDFLPADERAAFNELGIAHILSVSGFHVGVLYLLLLWLMRPLPLGRPARLVIESMLLTGYCLLTGGNAPVMRAALLVLWRELTRIRHRQILPLHLLSVTALLQLVFDPVQLTSASFQLTYGAMLGLLLVYPRIKRLRAYPSPVVQRLWEAFAASCSAQIGILLPQLYWFGQLPLLAILLNIPLTLGAGWLIMLYWLTLVALPLPLLREAVGFAASAATELLLTAVRALHELPSTALWTRQPDALTFAGWMLLLLTLSGLLPRRIARHRRKLILLGTLLIALILLPLPETSTECIMFSVGDEDAMLLQDQDMTVVIDAGEDGQALASYLHQHRRSVDALIITHLHIDHACGVQALLDEDIPVKTCYLPADAEIPQIDEETLPVIAALQETGTEFHYLSRGDVIDLPSGNITVLWPLAGRVFPQHDANDVNLVLQANIAGVTMLLTSDLSGPYEGYIAQPSDILKVAHHGSKSSTSEAFLAAVDPSLLLLSNRMASREERIHALAGDIPLYSTENSGAVTIRFLGNGEFTVQPYQ